MSRLKPMTDTITPFELKKLRKDIGASLSGMAHLLGLSGNDAATTVRKMENGTKPITMPVQRLAKVMQTGTALGEAGNILPKFLVCEDLEGAIPCEFVFHTRYPRFIASVTPEPIDGLVHARVDEVECLSVFLWIDEPAHDPIALVSQAARFFENYTSTTQDI